jgi:hypothetical protein
VPKTATRFLPREHRWPRPAQRAQPATAAQPREHRCHGGFFSRAQPCLRGPEPATLSAMVPDPQRIERFLRFRFRVPRLFFAYPKIVCSFFVPFRSEKKRVEFEFFLVYLYPDLGFLSVDRGSGTIVTILSSLIH